MNKRKPMTRDEREIFYQYRRELQRYNKSAPKKLAPITTEEWEKSQIRHKLNLLPPVKCWRSKDFLVQRFDILGNNDVFRLSINRCVLVGWTRKTEWIWKDGITWDELQQCKRECGYGEFEAVEIYPKDSDIVNVANIRHLWIYKDRKPRPLPIWRTGGKDIIK